MNAAPFVHFRSLSKYRYYSLQLAILLSGTMNTDTIKTKMISSPQSTKKAWYLSILFQI